MCRRSRVDLAPEGPLRALGEIVAASGDLRGRNESSPDMMNGPAAGTKGRGAGLTAGARRCSEGRSRISAYRVLGLAYVTDAD